MRKREKRVRRESGLLGSDRRGHGWAARQASKRQRHKSGGNPQWRHGGFK